MKLTIKYTSQIALAANTEEEIIKTTKKALLEVLKDLSEKKNKMFQDLLWVNSNEISPSILIIINGDQIQDLSHASLNDGDEVMLFSPMSGG